MTRGTSRTEGVEGRLPDAVTFSIERMIRFCHLADLTNSLSSSEPQPDWPPLHLTPFGTMMTLTGERRDLLEVLEDRYGQRATLVASQLPIDHWHDIVGDATFGDAILDRLVHHAHRIHLKGASMRRHAPESTN